MAQAYHPGFPDTVIAVSAQEAGLPLLTCDRKHFQLVGVACARKTAALLQSQATGSLNASIRHTFWQCLVVAACSLSTNRQV